MDTGRILEPSCLIYQVSTKGLHELAGISKFGCHNVGSISSRAVMRMAGLVIGVHGSCR